MNSLPTLYISWLQNSKSLFQKKKNLLQMHDPLYSASEEAKYRSGTLLSAVTLIAGTCIGAGMLALPLVTAPGGWLPSLAMGALCWLFMFSTGLLFLEATLWLEDGANVDTLTNHFLGSFGRWLGNLAFLLLYYGLLVSYLSAGSQITHSLLMAATGSHPPLWISLLGFTLFFATIVQLGTRVIDKTNLLLFLPLVASYLLLMSLGWGEIDLSWLETMDWRLSFLALPTLFSAYGFHNVIPSLSTYLRRQGGKLTLALFLGTMIPFIIYSLWQGLLIGVVPLEAIEQAADKGEPISQLLLLHTNHPWVIGSAVSFALCAIVTSLLGVALSMVDFLGDAFGWPRSGKPRLWLCSLTFLPPALLAWMYPSLFITAIGIAGGFGEAILNGLLPIWLVWRGRYQMGLQSKWRLPGGKPMLLLLLAITFSIMGLESYLLFGR